MPAISNERLGWELATESIVVRIRWFGVAMGYILVQTRTGLHDPWAVRAFLALGAGYAALDTVFHRMGEVFLERVPLFVSMMEAIFIALLCYHDTGLDSPFRWYYLLSLICCSIRYRPLIVVVTFGFHCLSLACLAWALGADRQDAAALLLTVAILAWATWATGSLACLLKATGARLALLNAALERHRTELEERVAERSEALRATQARLIHQEKMAAFGLLAAGIAHEVGNPLAALSSLIQMLRRRRPDDYTSEKLALADRQLGRIQRTIRELVDFSRPASSATGLVRLSEVVDEALGIAKYYHRTKNRAIETDVPVDLPMVRAVRDHLTQVVLNLVMNAIDATGKGGHIRLTACREGDDVAIQVDDDGRGLSLADRTRLFQPYFTTKPQGTGLGLFISRQIVEELGGSLTYESEPGQGASFRVWLPAIRLGPALVLAGASPNAAAPAAASDGEAAE
jgi:two-component system, NtrC family, sensor kinase